MFLATCAAVYRGVIVIVIVIARRTFVLRERARERGGLVRAFTGSNLFGKKHAR